MGESLDTTLPVGDLGILFCVLATDSRQLNLSPQFVGVGPATPPIKLSQTSKCEKKKAKIGIKAQATNLFQF